MIIECVTLVRSLILSEDKEKEAKDKSDLNETQMAIVTEKIKK